MPITRASLPSDLEEGLNAHFGRTYRDHRPEWSMVFDTETSRKAVEHDVLQTGFGAAPVKPEGSAVAFDEIYEGWTAHYRHETIALAFAITEEAVEDNLYQRQAPKNARALARALNQTKEIKGAAIFNNAFSSSYKGGDNVALCSDSHPTVAAGNQSNILATPADFAEASLEDMLKMIRQARDDRNIPIGLMPEKLIGHTDAEYDFARVLMSAGRPGTADNDTNAVRALGKISMDNVVLLTRMVDADAWFIKTDCPEGVKHMKRTGLKRGMQDDFSTGNVLYKARERYSFGWSDWRAVFGTAGAG